MNKKDKKEILHELDILIKSCEEGKDGTWDCTTDDGKEGFDDMIEILDSVKSKINKHE